MQGDASVLVGHGTQRTVVRDVFGRRVRVAVDVRPGAGVRIPLPPGASEPTCAVCRIVQSNQRGLLLIRKRTGITRARTCSVRVYSAAFEAVGVQADADGLRERRRCAGQLVRACPEITGDGEKNARSAVNAIKGQHALFKSRTEGWAELPEQMGWCQSASSTASR